MPEPDDKSRAEKLAAAKKKVEQMKKARAAKGAGEPVKKGEKKEDKKKEKEPTESAVEDSKEAEAEAEAEADPTDSTPLISPTSATPSLSQQSKLRSSSFRKGSVSGANPLSPTFERGPLSPGTETAPDIYRKQAARIEELERENKRLARESTDAGKRWQKTEEELADLREAEAALAGGGAGEVAKLKSDLAALQRQNAQLQARTTSTSAAARHGSSPSVSMGSSPSSELEAQLASRAATIETMELDMSRLRAQVERLAAASASPANPGEQVAALEDKLARAEKAAGAAQREAADLKRSLERAAEKAVREGGARAGAETKARALEREGAAAALARDEAGRRAEGLEKKVATLTTLHKEQDARTQALRRDKEKADRELAAARERLERAEGEALALRKKAAQEGGGTDDEHLDELEDEERRKLEGRVRALEAENGDLRRGIWHERRKEMQLGPDESPAGGRFTDVDLTGSAASPLGGARKAGGLGEFFTALTGGGGEPQHGHGHGQQEDEGFLDDDDMEFDEEAFRLAAEEDAKKRLERVKEVKRGLKNWEGWRLDLVESRRGGGEGIGQIFDV